MHKITFTQSQYIGRLYYYYYYYYYKFNYSRNS